MDRLTNRWITFQFVQSEVFEDRVMIIATVGFGPTPQTIVGEYVNQDDTEAWMQAFHRVQDAAHDVERLS